MIDHKMLNGRLEKRTFFNPAAELSVLTVSSLLCHMIVTKMGLSDDYDDFAALMSCRGDFALEPVEKTVAKFVQPSNIR